MGLTIHYRIKAPAKWKPDKIKAKLEEARQFAMTLPVVSVSEIAEFQGKEADFQAIRDSGREDEDPYFWAKIQACRSIQNPWFPGSYGRQSPDRMLVFSINPAEGCEQMSVGMCSYPQHVWKADTSGEHVPAWSEVFNRRDSYLESEKLLRSFMRRWRLRKLPQFKPDSTEMWRYGGIKKASYYGLDGTVKALIQRGGYLSHRKGYAGAFGVVMIGDRMTFGLSFRFMGTAEEAERTFSLPRFQAELNELVTGRDHVTSAISGVWGSFCKSQYANDPRLGGWKNFAKAHLSVLALLEHMQGLGFTVNVDDEGGFWKDRNIGKLAKTIGEWDALIAGMVGALKDVGEKMGVTTESAMSGRPDFERLEMQAQTGKIGDLLKIITGGSKP